MKTSELVYLWRIVDCYGNVLDQINEKGEGRKLSEIDVLTRPYTMYLVPQKPGLPKVSVKIDGTKRFIYFRHINKKVSMVGCNFRGEKFVSMFYVIGWQDNIEGKNVKNLMWVNPVTGEVKQDNSL